MKTNREHTVALTLNDIEIIKEKEEESTMRMSISNNELLPFIIVLSALVICVAAVTVLWYCSKNEDRNLRRAEIEAQKTIPNTSANPSEEDHTLSKKPTHNGPSSAEIAPTTTPPSQKIFTTYKLGPREFPLALMRACGEKNDGRALRIIKELNPQIRDWGPLAFKANQEFVVPCRLTREMVQVAAGIKSRKV